VEMPVMDGVALLTELMKTTPTPVVVLSSLTQAGGDTTIRCLELGAVSYDPNDERLNAHIVFDDHLCFVVSPQHRFAGRGQVGIQELGMETFIAHNVVSPYREFVINTFQRARVRLNMDVEMPTVETIRMMVQRNEGVAFLPKMCVENKIKQGLLCEIKVEELQVERKIRLLYPSRRNLSHAAQAFLELVDGSKHEPVD
ncbi:MAG TPA: LysR substrate-binding domain-containing protein, partial [Bryobacteraceae bacterium]|nr:LysR substrate-binding domain-containing protein [Bryobacteraceae bacterium]